LANYRASRRSIREFLRHRDKQWKKTASSTPQEQQPEAPPLDPREMATSVSPPFPHVFGDTLELLLGASLLRPQPQEGHSDDAKASAVRHLPSSLSYYGLTARDVCEILVHTPSVALMLPCRTLLRSHSSSGDAPTVDTAFSSFSSGGGSGETLQETLDRAMRLLTDTLKLRRYDVRKVLRSCPGLLTSRGSKRADQTVRMLTGALSVSASSIVRDKPGLPKLLTRLPSDMFRLVAFLAGDAVRMPVSQIGPLLRQPKSIELLERVAPPPVVVVRSSQALEGSTDVGGCVSVYDEDGAGDIEDSGHDANLNDLSSLRPWVGDRRQSIRDRRDKINAVYTNMTRTAWTLRNELGTADLGRVIAAFPSVLLLDAQTQVLGVARYLMDDLGVWKDDLSKVLQLYPTLLGMDVTKMRSVAEYLTHELEVDTENLALIFRSFPSLLTLSVEDDMRPVVAFLKEEVGIANVGRFVSRLPPVLGYSVERELAPKWAFLSRTLVDARFEVTRFPAYFSYPLERVIKARFDYLKHVKRIPIPLVSLDQVLRYGDKDFSAKVARDVDHGAAFAAFLEQRTTSSQLQRRVVLSSPSTTQQRAAKRTGQEGARATHQHLR
jgi:hypothetical protein